MSAFTKWAREQTALHWSQVYGLPFVALGLLNAYGPRSRTSGTYGAVFGVFLAQKLAGAPMTIVGDGTQTRDFTYVTDVAKAFLAAALSDTSGQSFNVGSRAPTPLTPWSKYWATRPVTFLSDPVNLTVPLLTPRELVNPLIGRRRSVLTTACDRC
jgi:hypothetical protein